MFDYLEHYKSCSEGEILTVLIDEKFTPIAYKVACTIIVTFINNELTNHIHIFSNACDKSDMISSICSIPMDNLMVPGVICCSAS